MERYKILEEIGDGTGGNVYKAVNNETFEIVAVKRMKRKFYNWEECLNLREVKSLRRLNHPNIIKLLEIVRQNNELFFIFEYMECNLYQIMKNQQRSLSEEEIRGLMSQVLQALSHVHKHGYFHRDLKPENLLVTNNTIKIADFGLARELSSSPPYTDYVSTRWYRAPEVLLQSASYTPAIDMWAVGAILAELFTSCPIFPGESEIDQLYKICCVFGAPERNTFPESKNISRLVDITYSAIRPADLSDMIPNASLEAIDLIKQLCSWDPSKRPTADQCLEHPFFHVSERIFYLLICVGSEPNLELDFAPNLVLYNGKYDNMIASTLFLVETVHTNQGAKEVTFISFSAESVFLCISFLNTAEPSLSLSFSPVSTPSIGVSQSTGCAMSPFQSSILDRPFMATSAGFQQGHYL
ncbi:hypothetical protein SASPL_119366 [Salvia splendens]|uniref:cyclin-dependent kinase n=1 Tax=Salvia splendens TaxID=180675 RepID=A0A8X8XSL1_SALSN|nr:hypothetical protein SASPL_119366 [Salvia splendens]